MNNDAGEGSTKAPLLRHKPPGELTMNDITVSNVTPVDFFDTADSLISALPLKFNVPDSLIAQLKAEYSHMEITNVKSYKAVTKGIARVRSLRTSVEKKRKELKADALAYGKRVDMEARRLTDLILPIENNLKSIKKAEDERKAAIKARKEALEKERVKSIRLRIDAIPPSPEMIPQILKMTAPEIKELQKELDNIVITPDIFQEFTEEAIKVRAEKRIMLNEYFTARIQADAKEIARIRQEKEAEARRVEEEKRLAAIKEEQEKEFKKAEKKRKEEEARLKKIAEEQAKVAARIKAEQDKIEAEKRAFQEEQERIKQEAEARKEDERQAKIKAEEEKRLAAIKAEQEKKEAEERKKAEAREKKRQAALKPDKEQLVAYCSAIESAFYAVEKPVLKTDEGRHFLSHLVSTLTDIISVSSNQAEELGNI